MKTGQMPKHTIEHLLPQKLSSTLFIHLSLCEARRSISLLKTLAGCPPNKCFTQAHTYSSDAKRVHECISSTLQKCENRMRRDLGCMEDVGDVELRLVVTQVPR